MLKQISPLLLDAAGQVATDALRSFLERRGMKGLVGSATSSEDVIRPLATANMYLARAVSTPTRERLYKQLAVEELHDALDACYELDTENRRKLGNTAQDIRSLINRLAQMEHCTQGEVTAIMGIAFHVMDTLA